MDFTRALPWLTTITGADETGPTAAFQDEDAIVVRPWTADLAVAYVVEEEGALVFVRRRDLRTLDVEELHRLALENLRDRAATHLLFKADGPIVGVFLDGRLDASMLLLDEPWEQGEPKKLPSPIVAVAAARDVLAVTSASSPEGVTELRAIAARGDLSQQLLVRRPEGWQHYG